MTLTVAAHLTQHQEHQKGQKLTAWIFQHCHNGVPAEEINKKMMVTALRHSFSKWMIGSSENTKIYHRHRNQFVSTLSQNRVQDLNTLLNQKKLFTMIRRDIVVGLHCGRLAMFTPVVLHKIPAVPHL